MVEEIQRFLSGQRSDDGGSMSLNYRKLAGDALVAFFAQGVSMLLSAMTSILVPKIMGVESFGYWQLFMFYTSYVGLFHLGINDGVYLEQGGVLRHRINKKVISSEFKFSLLYQLIFSAVLVVLGFCCFKDSSRSFVIIATAIFLLLNNLSNFLGFLFQAMNETKRYSISVLVDRFIFLIPLTIFLLSHCGDFKLYIIAYACSKTCCLLYCVYEARDIVFVKMLPLSQACQRSIESIRVGIKLTIANISSMLIVGIARALVDMFWGIVDFGQVSFSLSLVTFFLTFVSQASLVLFPALRSINRDELVHFYSAIKQFMSYFFPFAYALYFPIAWIMRLWLPQYNVAISYLAILMPICVFDTKMDICCTTYMKVLRMEKQLLVVNLSCVAISGLCCYVAARFVFSINAVLVVAVMVVVGRSLFSEALVNRHLGQRFETMAIIELIVSVLFVLLSFAPFAIFITGVMLSLIIYGIYYRNIGVKIYTSIRKHVLRR